MKNVYTNIRYFMFLLLVACISSCNKDGLTTLVIEDGQPSVAQMIIGQWTPDHVEWADEDGNVLERPEMPDIPDLNFDEGGTGTFGGNGSGSFDWTVDEGFNDGMGSGYHGEGPSITFGGERWYIFQLTKTILIIYRITDRYIIIYYYDRVGEYNGGNDEGPSVEPVDKCPYQPYEGERIVKIMEVGNQVTYKYEQVYLYEYDEKNRISSFSVGENEDNIYWTWSYKYDEEKVTAELVDRDLLFEGYFNNQGYISEIRNAEGEAIAWYDYNEKGYLTAGKTMNDYIDMEYDQNWNAVSVHYPYVVGDWKYGYGNDDVNTNSVDLNKVIAFMGFRLDATQTDMDGLFCQFDFLGRRSPCLMVSEEGGNSYSKYNYEITDGRISTITRYYGNRIYTYSIYYE